MDETLDRSSPEERASARAEERAGALDALVEVERRIEADLARARQQAADRIDAAREEARQILAGFESALAREQVRLRAALEREYEASRAEWQARSAAAAARHRSVDEDTVRALGRFVAARVAGSGDPA